MDTINGIPALADTDSLASVGQYSRDLRAWLDPAEITQLPSPGGEGWSNHFVYLLRWGPLRILSINTQIGSAPTGSLMVQLDPGDRPQVTWEGSANNNNSGGAPGYLRVETGGAVRCYWSGAAAPANYIRTSLVFPGNSVAVAGV